MQSAEIVVTIKYAEQESDGSHAMFGEAVGGQVSVARGSCIEDGPVFCAAVVPAPRSAKTQPVALRVIGQLADLGADAWPGSDHLGLTERSVGASESGLVADVLVVFHLRHVALKSGDVG